MTLYYLDASAWVKRYFEEPGSGWVQNLFQEEHLLSCSALGLIEVNATGRLSRGWLTPEVVERSLKLGDAFALRGSDCVHLATALALKGDLGIDGSEFTFVTSDQELKEAAHKAGLLVVDPQD